MAENQQVTSTIDILENFMAAHHLDNIRDASGRALWELGVEVQRFANSYEVPYIDQRQHPIYIGGWPSANFWDALTGPLVTSSLLYAGQVLVKDPILDWFSNEQYMIDHMMSSRSGYLNSEMRPSIGGTRDFLAVVVPDFLKLAPLIRKGAIILVPGERESHRLASTVDDLVSRLTAVPELDGPVLCTKFRPSDITIDDSRKGVFILAGGDRDSQLRRSVGHGLRYFAREYEIAQSVGVDYAAPWPFEQYLCEKGLLSPVLRSESDRVVQAIWASRLPIFDGLKPDILASVRDDESFAGFRAELFNAYRGISGSDAAQIEKQVAEAEEATLRPYLRRAEESATSGALRRAGVELTSIVAQFSSAYGVAAVRDQVDGSTALQAAAAYTVGRVTAPREQKPQRIFTKLTRHGRTVQDELSRLRYQPPDRPERAFALTGDATKGMGWNIADTPSMNVSATEGVVTIHTPERYGDPLTWTGSIDNRNGPCRCGSGIKWKNCCREVPQGPVDLSRSLAEGEI